MSAPRVTDKVVGVAFAAFTSDKFAHPVQAMRSALEAAVPLLAPQPVVAAGDILQALTEVYESGAMGGEWPTLGTDAVMELLADAAPQPVVDREALIEAISARLHITTDLIVTGGHPRHLSADTSAVHEAADAVLALLNGSES